MIEIGQMLQEARDKTGVSVEEAAQDLNIRPVLLRELEEGNISSFDDIFYVKEFLSNYAKYLGLDKDDILDDFNEYLFEKTSRIPLDAIKKISNEKELEKTKEQNIVTSPYTTNIKIKKTFSFLKLFIFIGIVLLLVLGYFIFSILNNKNYISVDQGEIYEFTK